MKILSLTQDRSQLMRFLFTTSFLLMSAGSASAQLLPTAHGLNPSVQAQPPYNVSLFAQSVLDEYSAPDSITFNSTGIYIGYGNNGGPGGQNSIPSTIIEYDYSGNIIRQVNIVGHNDGLKINPQTGVCGGWRTRMVMPSC